MIQHSIIVTTGVFPSTYADWVKGKLFGYPTAKFGQILIIQSGAMIFQSFD